MSDDASTRKSETVAQFNGVAAGFDSGGAFAHFGQRLVEVVGIEPEQRVLDVATGRGAVLFPAVERVGSAGGGGGGGLGGGMVGGGEEEGGRGGLGVPVPVVGAGAP